MCYKFISYDHIQIKSKSNEKFTKKRFTEYDRTQH
jgi:hypothetical protein